MAMKVKSWFVSLLVSPALGAQQFVQIGREPIPSTTPFPRPDLIDLDGDGALDIFCQLDLYLHNDGHGRFTPRPLGGLVPAYDTGRVLGDFDNDGDLDVLTFGAVLENRGALGPIWRTATFSFYPAALLGTGDFNGDQTPDVVTSNGIAITTSLTTFQLTGNLSLSDAVTEADLDGDGDLDLIDVIQAQTSPLFGWSGSLFFHRNDGAGTWTTLYAFGGPNTVTSYVSAIIAFDFDGDGDVDCGFLRGTSYECWRKMGNGTFVAAPGMPFGSSPLRVFDLDQDGDMDLIGISSWIENSGNGSFAHHTFPPLIPPWLSLSDQRPNKQAFGDIDGDSDLDIVQGTRCLLNLGGQVFFDTTTGPLRAIEQPDGPLVDVDGDHFPDLMCILRPTLWRNGGDGWFAATPGFNAILFADLDGDGDLDGLDRLCRNAYLNDGTGTFAPVTLGYGSQPSPQCLHAFDADGDNDIDQVGLWGSPLSIVLMRNVGGLNFVGAAPVPLPPSGITSSVAADFDNDNDIDLLLATGNPASVLLLRNDGTGAFALDPAGLVGFSSDPYSTLFVGDFDADGDQDVLVGGQYGANPQIVMLQNSGGLLIDTPSAIPAHSSTTLLGIGDIDGDGDLDAIVAVDMGSLGLRMHLWSNDGFGHFTFAADLRHANFGDRFVDVDLDGDVDLLERGVVYMNRQWHLEVPFEPQIGTTYVFRCISRAIPNALAIPWIASRSFSKVPGIGGTLCIDPQTATPLAWMQLNGETAEGSFAIPPNPALVGLPVSLQALLVGTNGELHLTPPKHEVVRP